MGHLPMRKSTRINAIYRRGNQRGQSPSTEEEINEDRRHLPKRKSTRIIAEEEINEDRRHLPKRKPTRIDAIYRRGNQRGSPPSTRFRRNDNMDTKKPLDLLRPTIGHRQQPIRGEAPI